jgi:hypothetical protein
MKIDDTFILNQSNNRIDKLSWRQINLKMNKKLSLSLRKSYKKETDFNAYLRKKIAST